MLQRDYGRTGRRTPGGVNINEFVPAQTREPNPTILFSGALNAPPKRVAQLVEALAIVARDEPCVRLWLSGPGDPAPIIESAPAAARDRIEPLPLGSPDEQASRYGRAWVTALPSVHEAFGLVLLESLACGTPVVASDGWGLRELVAPGETGSLCDPDSPESIARALLESLALSRRPGIADACRSTAEPYDWETGIAPLMERIYSGA
jgi:glycosyltransferase involved in cell wall biosynthesis